MLTSVKDEMTRVLIVDDHPLFSEALLGALRNVLPTVEMVDATSVGSAIEILEADKSFDLLLLDLNIPDADGFSGLMRIRGLFPRLPVVVVSGHDDPRVIEEALTYGIGGFIPKSSSKKDLAEAVKVVMDGDVYLPDDYKPQEPTGEDLERKDIIARIATLTPQQQRVLQMMRAGLLNKQIAYELDIGITTVKAHVSEILRKLNVYSRTKAVIEVSRLDAENLLEADESHRRAPTDT
ncbi:response regulator [Roseibium sp. Sym1]|uniref:response regulator n=1 Tax=Roseibium sp. Sym1 TaxID=3016006 RepID=UPI0022B3C78B|nr:response regulator transcription factor [Roseibium sp. Sym1]